MGNSREKQDRGYSRGRWLLERERCHIDRTEPPRPLRDAAPVRDAVMNVMRRVEAAQVPLTAKLESAWDGVAGGAVAAHTRPGVVRGTQLVVLVDSPVWLSELRGSGSQRLLQNIQARFGNAVQSLALQLDAGD